MKNPLLFISLFLFVASANAETIYLKDGSSLEGEVVSETDESVKIRQSSGADGFIETDYLKQEIRQIGGEAPAENAQANKSGQTSEESAKNNAPGVTSKEDVAYKSCLEDIAKEFRSLKSMWDAGYFSSSSFKDWQKKFTPKQEEFIQKYSAAKKVSYSYMKLAFEQLNDFLISLDDIERTKKKYDESLKNLSSADIKTKLETLLSEHKEFADKALSQAIKYNSLALEKATPSSE